MKYLGEQYEKALVIPPVNSECLLVEDNHKKVVNVVAHSSFDDRSFFVDSNNWKGVFSLGDGFVQIYIKAATQK